MKSTAHAILIAFGLAVASGLAGAAPGTVASGGAAATTAPHPDAMKDARAAKNAALGKCKAMAGDEKKSCQKDAKARYKAEKKDAMAAKAGSAMKH